MKESNCKYMFYRKDHFEGGRTADMNKKQKKEILKKAIKDASLPIAISQIDDLHPTTYREIEFLIHQIQNILIAEYSRYTKLKNELELF